MMILTRSVAEHTIERRGGTVRQGSSAVPGGARAFP
jgi:hypothetical protein